jgi:hypothetical protein
MGSAARRGPATTTRPSTMTDQHDDGDGNATTMCRTKRRHGRRRGEHSNDTGSTVMSSRRTRLGGWEGDCKGECTRQAPFFSLFYVLRNYEPKGDVHHMCTSLLRILYRILYRNFERHYSTRRGCNKMTASSPSLTWKNSCKYISNGNIDFFATKNRVQQPERTTSAMIDEVCYL